MAFTQTTVALLFGLIENALAENKNVEVKALGRTWSTASLGVGRLEASAGSYVVEGVPEEIARAIKLQAAPAIEIGIEFPKQTPDDEVAKTIKRWCSAFPAATTKRAYCRLVVTLKG
jgi:hypothetical protein